MAYYMQVGTIKASAERCDGVIPFLHGDKDFKEVFCIPRTSDHNIVLRRLFRASWDLEDDFHPLTPELVEAIYQRFLAMDLVGLARREIDKEKHEEILRNFEALRKVNLNSEPERIYVVSWSK